VFGESIVKDGISDLGWDSPIVEGRFALRIDDEMSFVYRGWIVCGDWWPSPAVESREAKVAG